MPLREEGVERLRELSPSTPTTSAPMTGMVQKEEVQEEVVEEKEVQAEGMIGAAS